MSSIIAHPVQTVQETEDEFDDEDLNHYVSKADITESIVTGQPVTALCGVTFVVNSYGGGKVSCDELAICLDCEFEYWQLAPRSADS